MAEPEAAVAIVHACAPEESVLLMRRAERDDDSWSGHWSLPGGRRDPDDPDLVHTALRELEEECGIRLGRDLMEASLPPVAARRAAGAHVLVAPFVFRVGAALPAVVDFLEAVDARWVSLGMLRDPARHCLQCVPGQPNAVLFPAIQLIDTPLWGFTYRLLTEWLALGPNASQAERAGLDAADRVLEFLLDRGLRLEHGWVSADVAAKVAAVKGRIPDAGVLERFSIPGIEIPRVNLLEARPDHVRIVGLAFEEYIIEARD